jgi:hypothetical protein
VPNRDYQVIDLELSTISDLFEMRSTDLFSEYRYYLTGIDFCLSEIRSRYSRKPVRLVILLPEDQIDDDVEVLAQSALHRYCEQRLRYNTRERRALRLDGGTALRIGIPITFVGLLLVIFAAHIEAEDDITKLVVDHLGWVLAWIGLWFPLDTIFFYAHNYTRENRALRLLRDADVTIVARPASPLDHLGQAASDGDAER